MLNLIVIFIILLLYYYIGGNLTETYVPTYPFTHKSVAEVVLDKFLKYQDNFVKFTYEGKKVVDDNTPFDVETFGQLKRLLSSNNLTVDAIESYLKTR